MTQLTQSYLHECFTYGGTGHLYWKIKKGIYKPGDRAGSVGDIYSKIKLDQKTYKVHRLVFLFFHGYLPVEVDHIDGNKDNNRIDNLRAATREQQGYNTKTPVTNKSGVKGVSWNASHNKWEARLKCNNKKLFLGYFKELDEAREVIRKARELYHGEFANHG